MRNYLLNSALIKYFIVGGLNAFFTFIIFVSTLKILKFNYLIALSIAWMLGVILTYILNFIWVFKPELNFKFKSRFKKYVMTNFLFFSFNLLALHYVVSYLKQDPFYSQLIIMPVLILGNFLLTKVWSMKKTLMGSSNTAS